MREEQEIERIKNEISFKKIKVKIIDQRRMEIREKFESK